MSSHYLESYINVFVTERWQGVIFTSSWAFKAEAWRMWALAFNKHAILYFRSTQHQWKGKTTITREYLHILSYGCETHYLKKLPKTDKEPWEKSIVGFSLMYWE